VGGGLWETKTPTHFLRDATSSWVLVQMEDRLYSSRFGHGHLWGTNVPNWFLVLL
jgi:hypothetical protein